MKIEKKYLPIEIQCKADKLYNGYIDKHMSYRAFLCYCSGFLPKTKFKKNFKINDALFEKMQDCIQKQWHHTSAYMKRTNFYRLNYYTLCRFRKEIKGANDFLKFLKKATKIAYYNNGVGSSFFSEFCEKNNYGVDLIIDYMVEKENHERYNKETNPKNIDNSEI